MSLTAQHLNGNAQDGNLDIATLVLLWDLSLEPPDSKIRVHQLKHGSHMLLVMHFLTFFVLTHSVLLTSFIGTFFINVSAWTMLACSKNT